MICFACFAPHPPLLIPEIGQDNFAKLEQTVKAYQYLEHELYVAKPDTVLIITPHCDIRDKAFSINQSPVLRTNFKAFGDLVTNLSFANDVGLGYQIKESCETSLPIVLTSDEKLDYGASVPLYYLMKNLSATKVIVVSYSNLSKEEHLKFGEVIQKAIDRAGKRVAIIASGDLSHRLHKDSPAGYSVKAQDFDKAIQNLINTNKIKDLINLDEQLIIEAGECGYRSLLILLGAIRDLNYEPEFLAYQAPFGIGYLTENFKILR